MTESKTPLTDASSARIDALPEDELSIAAHAEEHGDQSIIIEGKQDIGKPGGWSVGERGGWVKSIGWFVGGVVRWKKK